MTMRHEKTEAALARLLCDATFRCAFRDNARAAVDNAGLELDEHELRALSAVALDRIDQLADALTAACKHPAETPDRAASVLPEPAGALPACSPPGRNRLMARIGINTGKAAALALAALLGSSSLACTAAMYSVDAEPVPVEARIKASPTVMPGPYRLQVSDLLTVRFYRNPELDQDVRVRPDGKISLPYVDDVQAAGLTPDELDNQLTAAYTGELATPDVTVIVVEFGAQRVFVGGEVESEGIVEIEGDMTVYQAINAAGGFNTYARRDQVVLMRRDGEGNVKAWSIDMREIASGNRPDLDVMLRPFDVIHVPRSAIANVNLWIDQYIRENLPINPSSALSAVAAF